MNGYPEIAEAFRRAGVSDPASAARRDGTPIAARSAEGDVQLIRWRTGADLEPADAPYWAAYDTDEPFVFPE